MKAQYNRPGYSTTNRLNGVICRRVACSHPHVQELGRQPSAKESGMLAVSRRCTECGKTWLDYESDEPPPVWHTVAAVTE